MMELSQYDPVAPTFPGANEPTVRQLDVTAQHMNVNRWEVTVTQGMLRRTVYRGNDDAAMNSVKECWTLLWAGQWILAQGVEPAGIV